LPPRIIGLYSRADAVADHSARNNSTCTGRGVE
jgi:hypothetical protein